MNNLDYFAYRINELKEIINALQDANANVEQSLRDTKLTNQVQFEYYININIKLITNRIPFLK